ncbi:hypothetical protein ACEU2D_19790 [Brevibacillus laterosporus]|uniref:hypothetical protein n=1 Tax=Brevibacillus laterosporus TaxID=1465 RepID=UPI0035A71F7D
MHLGCEYAILSKISNHYRRQSDGKFRFTEKDYLQKIDDDPDLEYLALLENAGFVKRNNKQIEIDSITWLNFFVKNLNHEIKRFHIQCRYSSIEKELQFYKDEKLVIKFVANFNEENFKVNEHIINFCYVYSFEYNIFWFDLLTDINQLEFFCAYLNNQITKLSSDNRPIFDIFEGLKDEYLGEIYRVTIPDYFQQSKYESTRIRNSQLQKISTLIKKENPETYGFIICNHEVFFVKAEKTIQVLSFINDELVFSNEVLSEIEFLRQKLIKKISQFRSYTLKNENKVFDISKRTLEITTMILTPLNLLILIFTSYYNNLNKYFSNPYVIGIMAFFLCIVLIITFTTIIIPTIKLNFFKWKIKYGN